MNNIKLKLTELEVLLKALSDSDIAQGQSKYLKNKFNFFGIKKPVLIKAQKDALKDLVLKTEEQLVFVIEYCFAKNEREYQYIGIELAKKYHKLWTQDILKIFENMIRTKSWWDTVDTIAADLMGKLLLKYPELQIHMDSWITDEYLWIRRTAIIYQLKYKQNTNSKKLFEYCLTTMHEKDFFIGKAIGWSLRQYSKSDSTSVQIFILENKNNLSNLSFRQASKYIT